MRAPLGILLASDCTSSAQDTLSQAVPASKDSRNDDSAGGSVLGGEGKGLGALRKVLAEEFGACLEDLAFAAPEPPMKMMKKGGDRVVQVCN